MKDNELLPAQKCGVCGYEFDAATCIEGEARPRPGDITLCLKCGEVHEFTSDLSVKAVALDSMLHLDEKQHALLERAQTEIRKQRFIK